jgi:hypothetical protein
MPEQVSASTNLYPQKNETSIHFSSHINGFKYLFYINEAVRQRFLFICLAEKGDFTV